MCRICNGPTDEEKEVLNSICDCEDTEFVGLIDTAIHLEDEHGYSEDESVDKLHKAFEK